jgi:hypothetical protein
VAETNGFHTCVKCNLWTRLVSPLLRTGHSCCIAYRKQTHYLQFFGQCKPQAALEKGAMLRLHLRRNEKKEREREHAKKGI